MTEDDKTAPAEPPKPLGYWLIKALVVVVIFALAFYDLRTTETVPVAIYVVLAGLAGGPELAGILRGQTK